MIGSCSSSANSFEFLLVLVRNIIVLFLLFTVLGVFVHDLGDRFSVLELLFSVIGIVDAVYFVHVLKSTKRDHWISWRIVNVFLSELIHLMSFEVAHTIRDLNIFLIYPSSVSFHIIYSCFPHDRHIVLFSRCQRSWIPFWYGRNNLVVRPNVRINLIIVLGLFDFLLVLWIWGLVYWLNRLIVPIKVLSVWKFSDVAWHLLELFYLTLLECWGFSNDWALCELLNEWGLEVWMNDEMIFHASAVFNVSSALFAIFAVLASSALFAIWKWRHFFRERWSGASSVLFLIFCISSIHLIDILHKLFWRNVCLFEPYYCLLDSLHRFSCLFLKKVHLRLGYIDYQRVNFIIIAMYIYPMLRIS